MLASYHKLQQKPKTVPEFKNALELIWFVLPEKAIDNSVKDHHQRLQICVSAIGGHLEHFNVIGLIHLSDTNCYI